MANIKRWIKEEEDILVQAIKANPHNLKQCFREVSKKLDRSLEAVTFHWYHVLSDPENKKYVGTAFLVIGRKKYNQIRKNAYTNIGYTTTMNIPRKLGLWSKIKKLLSL